MSEIHYAYADPTRSLARSVHRSPPAPRPVDRVAADAIDAWPHPAWIVRDELTIEHANRAARSLMSGTRWLQTGSQRLLAIGDLDTPALRSFVYSANSAGCMQCVATVADRGRRFRVVLRVVSTHSVRPYAAAWPRAHALLTLEMPASEDVTTLWMAKLARQFNLTPTETHVLQLMSYGLSASAIAADMDITSTTVRTHLRALFDKTGYRRQTTLMKIAAGDWSVDMVED